jgi:hypothetical protein
MIHDKNDIHEELFEPEAKILQQGKTALYLFILTGKHIGYIR